MFPITFTLALSSLSLSAAESMRSFFSFSRSAFCFNRSLASSLACHGSGQYSCVSLHTADHQLTNPPSFSLQSASGLR